jgi:tetratricopeptide (TPR) repeat protein
MRNRSGRIFFFLELLFAWSAAVGPCRALAASAATEADAALKRGVELRRRGDDAQALVEFQRGYAIYRTARALAQIGFAEQALGRWHDAEEHLGQALADSDDVWVYRNRATIESSRALVAGHLGSLEVLGSPEGAELRVDGRLVGRLPLARPIRVAAGNVGVELRAEGYLPSSRPVTIAAGQLSRETITLQKIEAAPVAAAAPIAVPPLARAPSPPGPTLPAIAVGPRAPEETAAGWQRTAAWITGGAAVLFAAGAMIALVERGRYADQVTGAIRDGRCAQQGDQFGGSDARECAKAATNRDRARTLALVSGGLAGASALASTIFFAVGGRF